MMIEIKISIPKYLKTYLTSIYGEPYKATYSDELGVLILSVLKRKRTYHYLKTKEEHLVSYTIEISLSYFEKAGCFIDENEKQLITRALDKWFRNSMFRYAIINRKAFGIPYKKTILNFLKLHNIPEEELSYSTIRKDFTRRKKEKRLFKNL